MICNNNNKHHYINVKDQILKEVHIPNKKCMKIVNWQAMVGNLCGKKA